MLDVVVRELDAIVLEQRFGTAAIATPRGAIEINSGVCICHEMPFPIFTATGGVSVPLYASDTGCGPPGSYTRVRIVCW
jgi:hypothetical protein